MTSTARTPKTTTTTAEESPSAAASRYQQLRSHLAGDARMWWRRLFPAWRGVVGRSRPAETEVARPLFGFVA